MARYKRKKVLSVCNQISESTVIRPGNVVLSLWFRGQSSKDLCSCQVANTRELLDLTFVEINTRRDAE